MSDPQAHYEGNGYVYDVEATRPPNHDDGFASFTQPDYASQLGSDEQAHIPHEHHEHHEQHEPPAAGGLSLPADYQSRGTGYAIQYSPFIPQAALGKPAVLRWGPLKATSGERICFKLRIPHTSPHPRALAIMFDNRECIAYSTRLDGRGEHHTDCLYETVVPAYDPDKGEEADVWLGMEDEMGNMSYKKLGQFSWLDEESMAHMNQQRKRKYTDEDNVTALALKRPSLQQLAPRSPSSFAVPHTDPHVSPMTASQAMRVSLPSGYWDGYGEAYPTTPHSYHNRSESMHALAQRGNLITAQTNYSAPVSATSYSRYNTAPRSLETSRGTASISATGSSYIQPTSGSTATPQLVRTSTISPQTPIFNPYSLFKQSKAVLKIKGDLHEMVGHWSSEEWAAKRRLVSFERKQTDNVVEVSFKKTTAEERAPDGIYVSCIYWEEKGEFYITSVDTIYLLESIIAVRFTVEEKNRIRRNLEGFHPLTVSKIKDDSQEFFKLIMNFPTPKPRNIEKDIKVFPWKSLEKALKKIISKYSASWSSTAGALCTPMSGYSSAGQSEAGTEARFAGSPQTAAAARAGPLDGSTSSYPTRMMTSTPILSPLYASADLAAVGALGGCGGGHGGSAGPPRNLRVSVPSLPLQPQPHHRLDSGNGSHTHNHSHSHSTSTSNSTSMTPWSIPRMPGPTVPLQHYETPALSAAVAAAAAAAATVTRSPDWASLGSAPSGSSSTMLRGHDPRRSVAESEAQAQAQAEAVAVAAAAALEPPDLEMYAATGGAYGQGGGHRTARG